MFAPKKLVFAFVVVAVCSFNVASAQGYRSDGYCDSKHAPLRFGVHHGYGRTDDLGYHTSGYYRHYGHELANVIRSTAQANLLNAHARTQNEVARSARLDNDIKSLTTHFERRRINSTVRFAHLWERGAQAKAQKASTAEIAALVGLPDNAADRLAADELHPQTGRLSWPLLLEMEHFTRARRPVNELFKRRAAEGRINPDHYLSLVDWIEKVKLELNKNVHNYPAQDYVEAKDFLARLVAEARLPATTTGSMQLASK